MLVSAVCLSLGACIEASGPQASNPQTSSPQQLVRVSAEEQTGEPGALLTEAVQVKVVDGQGKGMASQSVEFKVTAGGGAVTPAIAVTDAEGIARAQWRIGSAGTNSLTAELKGFAGVTVLQFRAIGRESPGGIIARISGGGGSLIGGCTLPEPLVVRVTNSSGQPVANATVEFVASGDGRVTPNIVKTSADGLAAGAWALSTEGGTNTVRAVVRGAQTSEVSFSAESAPIAPGGFATVGNKIFNSQCKEHVFHGVARPSLQWHWGGDDRFVNIAEDFALIKSWNANVVRLPITQVFWVEGNKQYNATYKDRVVDAVQKARAAGLAVILDLHASDRGDVTYDSVPDVQPMADVKISIPFWRDVANTFKHDGGVIFELYNEPIDIEWDLWLNGGMVQSGPKYPGGPNIEGFEAAGMQDLYDAIRAAGARNLVIANGTHWGYNLNGVPLNKIRGYNIAYGAHPYDWPDKQPAVWEKDFGFLAATEPVILTEFGAYGCTDSARAFWEAALNYADSKGMSWVAWAWWTPPATGGNYTAQQRAEDVCKFPALLTDWNGAPSFAGNIIKQRLAAYPR